MPDGTKQPLSSREDIELAIKQKYGGKAFRLILKRANGERICEGKCINEAQPKYPNDMANPLPHASATDASVATRAIDAMASQQPDALRLSMEVLRSASEIVMRHNDARTAAPAATADSELDRAFKTAMIARMTQDPLESYLKIRDAIGGGQPAAANNGGISGVKDFLELLNSLKTSGLVSLGAPVVGRTTMFDIAREFIPVVGTVMHEYRLSREADARITEIQRSAMPPQAVPAVPQQNPPAAIVQLPPAQPAPPAAAPPAAPALTFQQIESHIAKIVKNVEFPVDEAVDKVLEFLYDTDPRIVGALLNPPSLDARLKPGKEGLMMLFTYEPELKDCLSNVPRLSEFLDKFIVAATEEEANQMRLRAAAPANAATPTPA
jgi:hypothetical protein